MASSQDSDYKHNFTEYDKLQEIRQNIKYLKLKLKHAAIIPIHITTQENIFMQHNCYLF